MFISCFLPVTEYEESFLFQPETDTEFAVADENAFPLINMLVSMDT